MNTEAKSYRYLRLAVFANGRRVRDAFRGNILARACVRECVRAGMRVSRFRSGREKERVDARALCACAARRVLNR